MMERDPRTTCDTCGTYTGVDSHLCGRCATDWNDRDQAAGRRRINARRAANGMPPMADRAPAAPDVVMGRWSNDA